MNNHYEVTQFIGKLASDADYNYRGEKPLAMLAMLLLMKKENIRDTKASDLLKSKEEGIKEHFIDICNIHSILESAAGSWSVIKNKELRKRIVEDFGVDIAYKDLTGKEIEVLISWYYAKLGITPLPEKRGQAQPQMSLTDRKPVDGKDDFEYKFGEVSLRFIEAWMSRRLQFEVKGKQEDFKKQLGHHLLAMEKVHDSLFHVYYMSETPLGKTDIENILIYNVDPARFSQIKSSSILFEFKNSKPPETPATKYLEHYMRYEIIPSESINDLWNEHLDKMLEFNHIVIPDFQFLQEPEYVWAKCQEYYDSMDLSSSLSYLNQQFAMEVTINFPPSLAGNVFPIIKPLFDGAISSFQYSQDEDRSLVNKVAGQLDMDESKISEWLKRQGPFCIATSLPVKHKGNGLRWDPHDHLCTTGLIHLGVKPGLDTITIDLSLYKFKSNE